MKKKKKTLKILLLSLLAVFVISISGFYIYTLDYYRADTTAIQTLAAIGGNKIDVQKDMILFYPDENIDNNTALIFYPGGKVENTAYVPLLEKISENGITCILLKMPFNLAVFDINKADEVYAKLPNIKNWYIAGHSLGGAMASTYVEKNSDKLKGLILLGAYPVNNSAISTIAIYGSEDINLDRTKLINTKNKIEIQGGNHAYFGNYGEQKGDGKAVISREEQQSQAVNAIVQFINQGK